MSEYETYQKIVAPLHVPPHPTIEVELQRTQSFDPVISSLDSASCTETQSSRECRLRTQTQDEETCPPAAAVVDEDSDDDYCVEDEIHQLAPHDCRVEPRRMFLIRTREMRRIDLSIPRLDRSNPRSRHLGPHVTIRMVEVNRNPTVTTAMMMSMKMTMCVPSCASFLWRLQRRNVDRSPLRPRFEKDSGGFEEEQILSLFRNVAPAAAAAFVAMFQIHVGFSPLPFEHVLPFPFPRRVRLSFSPV